MRIFLAILITFIFPALSLGTNAQNFIHGKVIKIVDGDTFDLLTDNQIVLRVRMNGIDCPEARQEHYKLCKDALANYILHKDIRIVVLGKDRWNRSLADVYLGRKNINYAMVRNGFAWHFKKYSDDKKLAMAEEYARRKKRGLWASPDPSRPWDFRKKTKKGQFLIFNDLKFSTSSNCGKIRTIWVVNNSFFIKSKFIYLRTILI